MISGRAAEWLRAHREELNQRFRAARQRTPSLSPERFLARAAEVLPPLADLDASGAVLDATFELLLLHESRDAFSKNPALSTLLREALPRLGALVAKAPGVVGALSNAVENLGKRASEFVSALPALGAKVSTPEALLQAGAVCAWRLGEARLRESALRVARSLPAQAVLAALGLRDWPDSAAALAIACLEQDAWAHPRLRVGAQTLNKLRGAPDHAAAVSQALAKAPSPPLAAWRVVGRAGDFAGFGGAFVSPPVLLQGGNRHTLFVSSGGAGFRVDADCFGWVCRPADTSGLDARPVDVGPARSWLPFARSRSGGYAERIPALASATSYVPFEAAVAFTVADSYRIRILAPAWEPA